MKPTGKKIRDELKLFLDKNGEVVGMVHDVASVQREKAGKKIIELELSQEAITGRKTDTTVPMPAGFVERIKNPKDPMHPSDLEFRGGRVNIKPDAEARLKRGPKDA